MPNRVLVWIKHHQLHLSVVLFWVFLVLVIRQYIADTGLSFEDFVQQLRDTLLNQWYGVLLYILVYMLRPLLFFPASLLTALAGNVYGLWLGFIYGLIAGTLSAVIPYAAGRWFAGDKQTADTQTLLQRFTERMRHNPFQAVLTMRLLYLPYDAVSFVVGNLHIPFSVFFTATALGNIVGTFAYVGIGASLEGDIASGDLSLNPMAFVLSVVLLVLSILISRLLRNRRMLS